MSKSSWKTKVLPLGLAAVCVAGMFAIAGCGGSGSSSSSSNSSTTSASSGASGTISVISREDGSGTRDAFSELVGVLDSNKVDNTTTSAVVTNSTSVMLTTVAGDANSIGYVSLGSLNDTVKALPIDSVEPTATTVKDGSYQIARPFNVICGSTVKPAAKDFLNYIMSTDGQKVVEDNGYVSVAEGASAYTADASASGSVVVAGSSSVTPVMEKLAEAYMAKNSAVSVQVQQSDSSTGVQNTIDGVCDLGMASRELKSSEKEKGVSATVIARDGIAVIVNKNNATSSLSKDQVKSVFTGETTDWSALQGK